MAINDLNQNEKIKVDLIDDQICKIDEYAQNHMNDLYYYSDLFVFYLYENIRCCFVK